MRALVTGCAGFIGSHLTEALLERGHSVLGIDCFNDNYGRGQKLRNLKQIGHRDAFEFVPVDLARGALEELIADQDVIFHLAAEPGVRSGWGERFEKYVQNNVLATQHILEAVKDRPDVRLVHASSSSVYGDAEVQPTPEEAPTAPLSPYGQTKLSSENLCHLYRVNFGTDVVTLRYFTVYGPRQRPDMAFHIFSRAALQDRPVTIFGDGTQRRDFTYVEDVVAATLSAAEADLEEERLFNIGGGNPSSLRDVLDCISELAGRELEIQFVEREPGDVRDTAADTSKARELLGFRPSTALTDGLRAELHWIEETMEHERLGPARA